MLQFVSRWMDRFRAGVAQEPDESRYRPLLEAIRSRRSALQSLDDAALRTLARNMRGQTPLVSESFALASEALRRTLQLDPFDVQLIGALAMHDGCIAEMQTGEGKTLTAVLPVFAQALAEAGAHVWTANDYLAQRDAAWMAPAYEFLGLSVASIHQGSTRDARHRAYLSDVTYATANEVGFDFLRDQLALLPQQVVQRAYHFVLIDEVDSILIDEARIPLVIAGEVAAPEDLARVLARLVSSFRRHVDFTTDEFGCNVLLTDSGIAKVEAAAGIENLFEPRNLRVFTAAQDAVHAHALLRRDVDYLVKDESIELIDEFKGRIAQNRRWPAGLQTALEAKEGLALRKQGRILGSITLQNLVRLYPRVCGMTGTAATQAQEFLEVYGLEVVVIPTHAPVIRVDQQDVIFPNKLAKERVLVEEIAKVHASGRPILVGTASVEESERLSQRVQRAGVAHQVMNARHDEAEARIIARAGEFGAVTISTNMAGRGIDIPLGGLPVRELGGLYVIGTNKHEARRIDNQLRGRAGRQGDPGSSRFFVSLEDDLMVRYGIREAVEKLDVARAIHTVQQIIESQTFQIRRTLWKYEGLAEHHRRAMQKRREEVLHNPEISQRERRITLIKMDDLWSDYLAAITELRGGIHWESWSGKDPLHTFLTRASEVFSELEQRLEEEVQEALEEDTGEPLEDSFDRSSTWTYLVNDQPFGTMQERWARAVGARIRALLTP